MTKQELYTGNLLLTPLLEIKPVEEFHPSVVERLSSVTGDCVISVKNSRMQSRRVSRDAVDLLQHFSSPKKLVEGVFEYAHAQSEDPQAILSGSFDFLISCVESGILDNPLNVNQTNFQPKFVPGEHFQGILVVNCIQALFDTQVYQGQTKDRTKVALKYVAPNASQFVVDALLNEVAILTTLERDSGIPVPKIISSNLQGEEKYLISTWCAGETLYHHLNHVVSGAREKVSLAKNLCAAYRSLHQAGVLHSDVHPNNVLVDKDLQVSIVDFGCSVVMNQSITQQPTTRFGSVSYYAPETAAAELSGADACPMNEYTEQYQLAILLYLILTGNMYLPISLDKQVALNQILHLTPMRLAEFGVLWEEMELVFATAFQKDPLARYQSLDHFHAAFINVIEQVTECKSAERVFASVKSKNSASNLIFEERINMLIANYGLASNYLLNGLPSGPTASLFHGSAGVAYTFLRLGYLLDRPDFIATSEIWIKKAKDQITTDTAFHNATLGIMPGTIPSFSLFHGEAGVHYIDAALQFAIGESNRCKEAVNAFLQCVEGVAVNEKFINPVDISLGPGGILLGLSHLIPLLENGTEKTKMLVLAKKLVNRLTQILTKSMSTGDQREYVGIAHGYAGLLYAIMWLSEKACIPMPTHIDNLLETLEAFSQKNGQMRYWPVLSNDPGTVWTGWCNGTTGHLLLWLLAYRLLGKERYLQNALDCGQHILQESGKSGASLCCGVAGESLGLLKLSQITNDKLFRKVGIQLAKKSMIDQTNFIQQDSLFRGSVGINLLAGEILSKQEVSWPLCDPIFPGMVT